MSSRIPIPTMSVAPTATPLSCRLKSKLVSTVTANAQYTAAPPRSGVATSCIFLAPGMSRMPRHSAIARAIGAAKSATAKASITR